jgi:hypothetical protein
MLKTFKTQFKQFSQSCPKMLRNPAGERNKQPILEALQQYIDINKDSRLLEISSGNELDNSN